MKTSAIVLAAATGAAAQQSLCDKYTTALLKENTAENQQTLLTLVVNTAVIGNYTKPNVGIAVPGILANGTGEFEGVSLLPYFTGALASSNRGGSSGVAVNFLDGGGAAPLQENKPANSTGSAQHRLLTHLYSYFGGLLGCSQFANTTGQYDGFTSQYQVHKYMGLSNKEIGYFINQVGTAAASFGVSEEDVAAVGKALTDAFGYKCSPPAAIPATATPALQAICIADDCPLSPNATCAAYAPVMEPSPASSNHTMGSNSTSPSNSSTTNPGTGSSATPSITPATGEAGSMVPVLSSLAIAILGLSVFLL